MNSRQRFLSAIQNHIPDRVPVTPDISNYIPARRTGLPFWDIYFHKKIELWEAYIEAADYFKMDMWIASCTGADLVLDDRVTASEEIFGWPERDAMIQRTTWRTPDGELSQEDICFRADPPTHRERMIKDINDDWPKMKWLLRPPHAIRTDRLAKIRSETHRRDQAFGVFVGYPGFHRWERCVEGSVQTLTYALLDQPAILDEWAELDMAFGTTVLEMLLQEDLDYLTFGGSGTLTLASPELARKYALPSIKLWTKMAKDAGVPTILHSCGRSRELVKMLAEETDLCCINPLEVPPMGDIDLGEVKRAHGAQLALMGNLHTTDVMLRGSAEEVYNAARDAILAAGENGGFVLSTGDQCPRETPDENIFALHDAVRDFGTYSQQSMGRSCVN